MPDDQGRQDGRDATGRIKPTTFRLLPEDKQRLADLVAEFTDRTGHDTSANELVVALIRQEHKSRCKPRKK